MAGKQSTLPNKGRSWKWSLVPIGGVAVLGILYIGIQTVRTGHSYNGTPEEIVEALLQDIRADIHREDWSNLGSYGVSTFLSWKNEDELRQYIEEDLGNGTPGPVDYILRGVPGDVTSVGKEIHFRMLDASSETTCRVVVKKDLGLWHVKDISEVGTAGS